MWHADKNLVWGASYDKKSIRKVAMVGRIPEATWCLE
jgi:hypothetical protein